MSYAGRTRAKIFFNLTFLAVAFCICGFVAYSLLRDRGPDVTINADFQQQLLEKIRNAKPGARIDVPAGKFELSTNLLLRTEGVTLAGAGADRTYLSFLAMEGKQPAIQVDADGITVSGLNLLDVPSSAILISTSNDILVQDIETNAPTTSRERLALSYGVVVRRSSNVLLRHNSLLASRNSGVLVLDSDDVMIKDNQLKTNTIGLQLVSSRSVDVLSNNISYNSMGVLISESPAEASKPAKNTRLLKNTVTFNNRNNMFSSAEIAQLVFAGVGLQIVGVDKVEVVDNVFRRNDASNIVVFSNDTSNFPELIAFDPYAEGIYIANNALSESGMAPGNLATWRGITLNLPYPDVLYDGVIAPTNADSINRKNARARVCVSNNKKPEPRIVNLDLDNYFGGRSRLIDRITCSHRRLPATMLTPRLIDAALG